MKLISKFKGGKKINNTEIFDKYRNITQKIENDYLESLISQLAEKVSGEGSKFTLENTIQARFNKLILKGQIGQESYEGYNLWGGFNDYNANNLFVTKSDGTILVNLNNQQGSSATTVIAIPNGLLKILTAGTYTFTVIGLVENLIADVVKRNPNTTSGQIVKEIKYGEKTSSQFTLEEEAEVFVRLNTSGNVTLNGIVYLQIEKGSTAHDWEPYTGGIPAPNLDYKFHIKSVTGKQTVTERGKNLAHNVSYYNVINKYGTVIRASYSIMEGKKYAISFDTENTGIAVYRQASDITGISIATYNLNLDGTRKTLIGTATATGNYSNIAVILRLSDNSKLGTGLCSNFMIEEIPETSNTATDYEPYIAPITTEIDLENIEVFENGTITEEDENWYVNNEWERIDSYNEESITGKYYSTTGQLNTGASVVYKLTETSKTKINDTDLIKQLNNLKKLMSINGTTVIECESEEGNLSFILEVEALSKN